MISDVTVLYYSSNSEDSNFEKHIMGNILRQKGDLPLISVTQKPFPDFGDNICVGPQLNCYGNEFRQIQIGLQKIKTKYVIVAEADVLYPPEYFQFQPVDEDYYRYANVWTNYVRDGDRRNKAYFKLYSDGAQIVKTTYWLDLINQGLGVDHQWFTLESPCPRIYRMVTNPANTWTSDNPVITFKTVHGVARYTTIRKDVLPQVVFPYWGDINKLKRKIFK
jgi:hypothetical protein